MKELQELRNEILTLRNYGVINKQEELSLLTKLNALKEAITVTRCCTELKDKQTMSFEEYTKSEGYTEISHELYKKENSYCNKNNLYRKYKNKHNL